MRAICLFTYWLLIWTVQPVSSQQKGTLTRLGPQVFAAAIQGSTFAIGKEGEELVFTVVRGLPARFVGFKVDSGEKVVDAELPGTDGSWDLVVSSDGTVYIAGANGNLYSHQPGAKGVQNLGKPIPGERLIWDLTAGDDGVIYGGTYPGCRVFRYHPEEGAVDLTLSPVAGQENYVRSLEYHRETGKVFVGVGSHAHLVALDLKTGDRSELLPERERAKEFVYHLNIIKGLAGGDRLFAYVMGGNSSDNKTLVYNIRTKKFEPSLPVLSVKETIKAEKGDKIYFFSEGALFELDYSLKNRQPVKLNDFKEGVKAVAWDKRGRLSILTSSRKVVKYDLKEHTFSTQLLEVPKLPIAIQSILYGPDKRIWSAGYLAGGHAAYDPVSGKTTAYDGLHQTEGMAVLGDDLYFGVYTNALLYRFNTQKPWSLKEQNPKLLGRVPHQDRPFAVLPLQDLDLVLFGTIPAYGQLGGTIAQYHTKTEKLAFFDQVVPDQSITSLVSVGGKVIGASSIFGGLGGVPTQKSAVVFQWDPLSGQKVAEFSPLSGQMAITGLMEGPDGNLWGLGDGTLFVYDLAKKEVKKTIKLYEMTSRPTHIWRNGFMQIHPNGKVYLSASRKLYCIDPEDFSYEVVVENADLLTMDDQGRLYMRDGVDLLRYDPAD